MRTILILSLVVLAVLAAKASRGTGRPKHPTRAPITADEFKKTDEKAAKLSPEARDAYKKIWAAIVANAQDFKARQKAIEKITASLAESAKKELESLRSKEKIHGHKHGHEGHKKGPEGPKKGGNKGD